MSLRIAFPAIDGRMPDENRYSLCGMGEHCRELAGKLRELARQSTPPSLAERFSNLDELRAPRRSLRPPIGQLLAGVNRQASCIRAKFASAPPTPEDPPPREVAGRR